MNIDEQFKVTLMFYALDLYERDPNSTLEGRERIVSGDAMMISDVLTKRRQDIMIELVSTTDEKRKQALEKRAQTMKSLIKGVKDIKFEPFVPKT